MNVLIADDNIMTAKLLKSRLSQLKTIRDIEFATNGFDVLNSVKKKHFDLLLLDISMPKMDGMQTLFSLKKQKSDVRIIMLSVHCEGWIIRKSINIGASGYVTKLSSVNELIEGIEAVMHDEIYLCKIAKESVKN